MWVRLGGKIQGAPAPPLKDLCEDGTRSTAAKVQVWNGVSGCQFPAVGTQTRHLSSPRPSYTHRPTTCTFLLSNASSLCFIIECDKYACNDMGSKLQTRCKMDTKTIILEKSSTTKGCHVPHSIDSVCRVTKRVIGEMVI